MICVTSFSYNYCTKTNIIRCKVCEELTLYKVLTNDFNVFITILTNDLQLQWMTTCAYYCNNGNFPNVLKEKKKKKKILTVILSRVSILHFHILFWFDRI